MNRKSGSGSGPFLMEMLVVVGFFIICASICVLVFVKADNISKDARNMNQAVLKAQSLAEEIKAGQTPRWFEQLPDRNIWGYLYEADQEGKQTENQAENQSDSQTGNQSASQAENQSASQTESQSASQAENQDEVPMKTDAGAGGPDSEAWADLHVVYWDSSWQETEPQMEPPFLGVIRQSVSDGMEKTDVTILKYKGRDKGSVLYHLETETYTGL